MNLISPAMPLEVRKALNAFRVAGLTVFTLGVALLYSSCGGSQSNPPPGPPPPSGGTLSAPMSAGFGNTLIGTIGTVPLALRNIGAGSITIQAAGISGNVFTLIPVALPQTLAPGQNAIVYVQFTPNAEASFSGSLVISSDATNPTLTISFSGTGVTSLAGSGVTIMLNWIPSDSAIMGYNIYRGTQSGGPYFRLNANPISSELFVDQAVSKGSTYFYVVTAMGTFGAESSFSNEAPVSVSP